MTTKYNLSWRVGHSDEKKLPPKEFVEAQVPGAVQLDWARAKGYPNPFVDVNFNQYKWMEDQYWRYKAKLPIVEKKENQRVYFVSKGIDYEFEIYAGETFLFHQEGMFTEVELDITEYASAPVELCILIHPIPKDKTGIPDTREEARQSVKPAAPYQWDWHPRLVPLGIWEDTYLEVREENHLTRGEVTALLDVDCKKAHLTLQAEVQGRGTVTWRVMDPKGDVVFEGEGETCHMVLENPILWWCNGFGEPALYTWEATLLGGNTLTGKTGIRRVELTMNEGSWEEPEDFPKTRSVPPITITLNGVRIFAQGSNWVCPEVFPGVVTKDTYEPQLTLVKEAHMNLLRCWGGAYVDKESFFELCDQLGIMVWQEFPLACNDYYDNDHYLEILEQEAVSIIKRLKTHPCVVLWCGGNELFNNWSGMHEQKLALRLLNKLCYEYDRATPFIMTSPLMGMGHGNYLFQYHNGEEVLGVMQRARYTAYTEFGIPSITDKRYLLKYISPQYLEPFTENEVTLAHHAFSAWYPGDDTWSCRSIIEAYFGRQETLEALIEKSQWMQCQGYKGIFEEARRQKPYCSMAINWCLNEPWPTIANNSILSYPAIPKPAYYAIKESLRPVVASARIPRFRYMGGELFEAELWLLNNGREIVPAGRVEAYLQIGTQKLHLLTWEYESLEAGINGIGPCIRYLLPDVEAEYMEFILEAGELSNGYRLCYQRPQETRTGGLKITNG